MFIKAHVRGGYRAATLYLEDKGKNEVSRIVHISDPDANDLDEAFHNIWQIASSTKAEKPLFHFSINPFKDERLTDKQVKRIAEAYAAKCKMDITRHQHVIVEHVKDRRQHFHVMLNRVDEMTGKAVDPGLYKKKAKECAREMEMELNLRKLTPKARKPRPKTPFIPDQPYPKRKGKTGKSDGHGGGAASILSAYKITQQEITKPIRLKESPKGIGNGPDRRRRNLWVPVERREQKPKC